MNPLEKIDFVFFYVKDKISVGGHWGHGHIWSYVERATEFEINLTLFDEIISKLKEDGLITEIDNSPAAQTYHVTFKGLVFDGYKTERESLNAEKLRVRNIENQNQKLSSVLNRLTFLIALGTGIAAIYYLLQIWDYFFCK